MSCFENVSTFFFPDFCAAFAVHIQNCLFSIWYKYSRISKMRQFKRLFDTCTKTATHWNKKKAERWQWKIREHKLKNLTNIWSIKYIYKTLKKKIRRNKFCRYSWLREHLWSKPLKQTRYRDKVQKFKLFKLLVQNFLHVSE